VYARIQDRALTDAIDNLAFFMPHLLTHEMYAAVEEFERSMLFYARFYAFALARLWFRFPQPSPCSTAGNSSASSVAPGAATPTEQLVAVSSELVDGLAAALILGHLGQ
jgi:hypothetical protein